MNRINWLDSLKGFGIFCVTWGHLSANFLIETHIYSFHMPLFFFLSGFLHNNYEGKFEKYIVKKTKALFIPFLFWNFLYCLVGIFLGESFYEAIKLFFLWDGTMCWNAPIWFLLQLYIVAIIYFFIEKYIPCGKYFIIPLLIVLWFFGAGNNMFLKLNITPACLLFYIFGNIFKQFYVKYDEKIYNKPKILLPAVFILFSCNILFGLILNKRISFFNADFGNIFYCALAAISGVLFYIIVFRNIPSFGTNKVLLCLGKNSLIIMATQYWFFTLFDRISWSLADYSIWYYRNTFKSLVMSVITISLICLIIELLKKISIKVHILRFICTCFGINLS